MGLYQMYDDIQSQISLVGTALKKEQEHVVQLRSILDRKRRRWIVGMGSSLLAARAATHGCKRGCYEIIESTDVLQPEAFSPEECDLAIAVSQSGESFDTVSAAQRLACHGVEVWAVTNNSRSRLAELSKEVIPLRAGEETGSATKTFTISLALLSSLVGTSGELDSSHLSSNIAEALATSEKIAHWARCLAATDKLIVLGVGRDKFIAQEAALMLQEKARIFALGISAAEFIHGPLEVVRPGLPVILIETGQSSKDIVRPVARRVSTLGAKTFRLLLCASAGSNSSSELSEIACFNHSIEIGITKESPTGGAAGVLSSILAVIPFQLLSYYLALEKGFDPDTFQHIGKVQTHY